MTEVNPITKGNQVDKKVNMSDNKVVRRLRNFIAEEISSVEMRHMVRQYKVHASRICALEAQVKDLIELNNTLVALHQKELTGYYAKKAEEQERKVSEQAINDFGKLVESTDTTEQGD